jgi:hypothetical protein
MTRLNWPVYKGQIDHATHMYRYLIAIGWEPDAVNIEIGKELFSKAIDELNRYSQP